MSPDTSDSHDHHSPGYGQARWQQLQSVFHEASGLPVHDRDAFAAA